MAILSLVRATRWSECSQGPQKGKLTKRCVTPYGLASKDLLIRFRRYGRSARVSKVLAFPNRQPELDKKSTRRHCQGLVGRSASSLKSLMLIHTSRLSQAALRHERGASADDPRGEWQYHSAHLVLRCPAMDKCTFREALILLQSANYLRRWARLLILQAVVAAKCHIVARTTTTCST